MEETSNKGFTNSHNQFDRLNCLQHADDSRQDAEHARLRAVWDRIRRRRFRKKAAVARPAQVRREHRCLTLKTEYRAINVWLPRKNADVVGQIARRKIIRPVHDHIVSRYKLRSVFAGETALMQFDLNLRI